jgi:hypothetical protein
MKKTYLTPETILQKIELARMIATSGPELVNPEEETAEADDEVLSRRRRNQWDDDQEELEEQW